VTAGMKAIIYPVKDLGQAKTLYGKLLGVAPDMDEAYYVGFSVGGQDVGLDPNGHSQGMTGPVGYWQVDDIEETLTLLPGRSQPRSAHERRGVSAGCGPHLHHAAGATVHRTPVGCVCVQRKPSPDSPMPGLSALIRRWTSSIGPQAPRSEFDNTTTSSRSAG
jgi:hypothetical protein